ncbi:MAG: YfcE family phosphodiesterase [Phycisphaeraceae bacterium]
MRVGVISDTHDRLPTFRRAMAMFRQVGVGAVFHAGDFVAPFAAKLLLPEVSGLGETPVHCVLGNNDGERAGLKAMLPQVVEGALRVEVGGRVVVMSHFIEWLRPEEMMGADVVITGHTHEAGHEVVEVGGQQQLRLNPGECCGWVTDRCTVALLDLETLKADVVEVYGGP